MKNNRKLFVSLPHLKLQPFQARQKLSVHFISETLKHKKYKNKSNIIATQLALRESSTSKVIDFNGFQSGFN